MSFSSISFVNTSLTFERISNAFSDPSPSSITSSIFSFKIETKESTSSAAFACSKAAVKSERRSLKESTFGLSSPRIVIWTSSFWAIISLFFSTNFCISASMAMSASRKSAICNSILSTSAMAASTHDSDCFISSSPLQNGQYSIFFIFSLWSSPSAINVSLLISDSYWLRNEEYLLLSILHSAYLLSIFNIDDANSWFLAKALPNISSADSMVASNSSISFWISSTERLSFGSGKAVNLFSDKAAILKSTNFCVADFFAFTTSSPSGDSWTSAP